MLSECIVFDTKIIVLRLNRIHYYEYRAITA